MFLDAIIGLLISFIVAFLAYLKKSLNVSGMVTAILLGTIIYMFGGFLVWGSLIAFFISSSLITKISEKSEKKVSKGRNYVQVLANGLVAAIFSIVYYILQAEIFLLAAVVSIATSNSDTWASEIGSLSKGKTFYILNFKIAPKGVSGAISGLGTFASFIGAFFIAGVFIGLYAIQYGLGFDDFLMFGGIITICGFLGNLIDSYLGGLIQAKYRGVETGTYTEKRWLPNEKVVLASGLALITNDAVNLLSGLAASLITLVFFI
ncbi:MAG TPA: DUF92 domain-containing protein [Acholeplasmataceae bacterium]|nr:DUF92 domain-containing protein [Acholeplasmataceae bacterium]HBO67362.1 DUF92 domain-containing protein [Acholeplasmataceae bacterium]HBS01030.1 DUF92 domain-containing protein [Acholeplasmataceae bacterium]HCB20532.1 DUF92 domain-containing protein [Acholeplasmataceae bacterium]HCZ24395.1 DUF92 domain-containing protein [Acholeplasmataceae bacterium]